ncbi:hypothetical protein ACFO3U_01465 [Flavobacterium ponti]|uniref:Uncharacterized protein n=1 Tax=Flavobacterium ponti TaxID=665133 RepID=A0ABV9P2Z1_9FLAO
MKTLKTLLLSLFIIVIISCDNDNDPTNNVCDSSYLSVASSTVFTTANGYTLNETMDLETHEYTMVVNSSGEICSIGYQNPTTYAGTYEMEVENSTTNITTTDTFSFSQSNIQYQNFTVPLIVNSGDTIVVRRTISNGYTLLNETIGSIYINSNPNPFPIAISANATIISSNFYGAGGPVPNFGVPLIGIGFKLN